MIEAASEIAADFNMLHLVLTYWYDIAVISKNVRRHEHGISEDTRVARQSLRLAILISMTSLKQSHWRTGHQQPAQFAHFGYIGLHEERCLVRFQAEGEQVHCEFKGVLPQHCSVANLV